MKQMTRDKSPGLFSLIINWDSSYGMKWMQNKWHYSVYISMIYVCTTFMLKSKMESKEPFRLRKSLALWNIALSIFSMTGTYFMLPELLDAIFNHSFYHSVCILDASLLLSKSSLMLVYTYLHV